MKSLTETPRPLFPILTETCMRCDGCGWYEGGKTIKTFCEKCNGTGEVPRPMDTPLSHIRNCLQILKASDPMEQTPREIERTWLAVESRLFQALQQLEGR